MHRVIASDELTECIQCGSIWQTRQYDDWHTPACTAGRHVPECQCPACLYGDDTASTP